MPRLKSVEDLRRIRETAQKDLRIRTDTGTRIIVGLGTGGIAAGARETMQAILEELYGHEIDANVAITDCIGTCSKEPLVVIEQVGKPRVTYCNVHAHLVPRLIEEHLVKGNVVQEMILEPVPGVVRY